MATNYQIFDRPYPRVQLHPATTKHMTLGHPWVTKDSFTARFPADRTFLIGLKNTEEFCVIMHDPSHKNVKARVWTQQPPFVEAVKRFPAELQNRLDMAFKIRRNLHVDEERENYYLVFGEADMIPGLMILRLGSRLLIQEYAGFWKKLEAPLLERLGMVLKEYFPGQKFCAFIENRNDQREKSVRKVSIPGIKNDIDAPLKFTVKEFGVNYNVVFDEFYDHGLYTDMSAVRKRITKYIKGNVLNLYSYTGAFSLFSLKSGAARVVSIDLSQRYLDWLGQNLAINEDLDASKHTSICSNVNSGLNRLANENQTFDLIICDPPTASSDGHKTTNAITAYEKLIPQMERVLSEAGAMIVFQNTHQISKKKFEEKILELAKPLKLKLVETLKLSDDCRTVPQFKEGNYLNGLVLVRK